MKVLNLTENSRIYTSNAYLITGTWRSLADVNALVDTGRDPSIVEALWNARTGVGARRLSLVVLTHTHYDHVSALPLISEAFDPVVMAFSSSLPGVHHVLRDGEELRLGDRCFEVIHTPGHSSDSICLYCAENGSLFSGDTSLQIQNPDGTYEPGFINGLERLCRLDVRAIYPGHGRPTTALCNNTIKKSFDMVSKKKNSVRRFERSSSPLNEENAA